MFFLKSRREDYEISPQLRTQMGDGYDFFASVRDGVSIQHAFSLTNLVLVVVLVVKSKAPYYIQALCYVCSNKAFQKAVEIFNNRKPVDAQKCQDCMR